MPREFGRSRCCETIFAGIAVQGVHACSELCSLRMLL